MRELSFFESQSIGGGSSLGSVTDLSWGADAGLFAYEDASGSGSCRASDYSSTSTGFGTNPPNNQASWFIGSVLGVAVTPIPAIAAGLLGAYIQDNPSTDANGMISDIYAP